MNRSTAWVGIVLVMAGIALAAFPIYMTGHEQLDDEQIVGCLLAPVGLFVVLIAAVSVDPATTTVPGAFGNPDEPPGRAPRPVPSPPRLGASPYASVYCRNCRAVITADLARCPRCSRARECHRCGRPLGQVLDRPTCPRCGHAEPFCDCPILVRPAAVSVGRGVRSAR
jgi:RNA polymerase subunit RPABC4/transcription elongation factor Spt4